jgi:endonuclease/exonuclease/phosphatase family metal-dependent hydrolase
MRRFWCRCATLSIVALGLVVLAGCPAPSDPTVGGPDARAKTDDYLFCFWNVENLFDDADDGRRTRGDKEYDSWFARDREALKTKLDRLCDVLAPLNDGRGPDILAVAEVESERSAQLLADALGRRLGKPELAYSNILYKAPAGGRHIATAVLTRLPVVRDRTDLWDKRRRILKTVVRVNQHELIVVASHWTSRVSDRKGTGRAKYADVIYGQYKGMYLSAKNRGRDLDFLVCGDFNDNPDDPSVTEHLHATGDRSLVRSSDEPLLFNLFAKAWKEGEASHYYGKKAYLFDQICVSPGLLDDRGWSCDVSSAQIVKQIADRQGRPNRFGSEHDRRPLSVRGASDHFPVTVRLRVQQ